MVSSGMLRRVALVRTDDCHRRENLKSNIGAFPPSGI
jgi:hypothetical protein